eukprot:2612658-Pyramimonas_sp.AAC.1
MSETCKIRMRPPGGPNPRHPAYMARAPPAALDGRSLRGTLEMRPVCKVYRRLIESPGGPREIYEGLPMGS